MIIEIGVPVVTWPPYLASVCASWNTPERMRTASGSWRWVTYLPWLDRRRPGQGKYVTQRQEPDAVRILSGVFQDAQTDARYGGQVTTGTPISMIIDNLDQRSRDYSEIAQ